MIYYKFLEVLRSVFVVRALSSMLLAVTEKTRADAGNDDSLFNYS